VKATLLVALAALAVVLPTCGADPEQKTLACSEPFDSADWRSPKSSDKRMHQLAEQVVRCKLFEGEPRASVERRLGPAGLARVHPGDGIPGHWVASYEVAWVGDAVGIGDAQYLDISYDRRKRLVHAQLAPEGEPYGGDGAG
jgi:hypothetical protein